MKKNHLENKSSYLNMITQSSKNPTIIIKTSNTLEDKRQKKQIFNKTFFSVQEKNDMKSVID